MSVTVLPERLPEKSLAFTQQSLCDYLRNPDRTTMPEGLDTRRLGVYRDLVFNNIESFLGSGYPILKTILGEYWPSLVREFIADYRAQTPYFTQLAKAFFQFLQGRQATGDEPGYLLELAHHELQEIELIYRESESVHAIDTVFSDAKLALSSLAEMSQYRYPVHEIGLHFLPDTVPDTPTYLLVYRNAENTIVFMQLSDLAFQVLSLISQHPGSTGGYWMRSLVDGMRRPVTLLQKKVFIENGLALLKQLFELGVLYATSVTSNPTLPPRHEDIV